MSLSSACLALSEPIFCFYINKTNETQIARFGTSPIYKCDRLVRPNEHLLFEALPESTLEIYARTANEMMLVRSLVCQELKVSNELIENMLHWLS